MPFEFKVGDRVRYQFSTRIGEEKENQSSYAGTVVGIDGPAHVLVKWDHETQPQRLLVTRVALIARS